MRRISVSYILSILSGPIGLFVAAAPLSPQISQPRPLGIEADEPGSMWLEEGRLLVRQRSPRAYDGVDIIVTAPADHSNDGANEYEYRAIDNLGNAGDTGTCTVRIDTSGPAVTSDAPTGWSKTAVTVTLTAIDSGSGGVAKIQYCRSGSSTGRRSG